MTVRTGYVGTEAVGDVLTAANFNKLPGGWLGDAQATSSQTGITTVTDLTGLSVTVTVGTSRRIRIDAVAVISTTVIADLHVLSIKEGATVLSQIQAAPQNTNGETYSGYVVLTPTAGAHTYKLTLERLSGTGTCGIAQGATNPASIHVFDLGPAS